MNAASCENLGPRDLSWLLSEDEQVRLSIYMPLADPSEDARVNDIRLKNALRQADELLGEQGLDKGARKSWLSSIETMTTDASDWDRTGGGLCLFSDGEAVTVRTGPLAWDELVSTGTCFQVLPAIPFCRPANRVYVLALSQKHAWLAQVSRHHAERIEFDADTPTSLEQAVGREREEQHLQFHTAQGRGDAPIYHAQGGGKDDVEPELERFCRAVDEGVQNILSRDGSDSPTLLLAGDVKLTSTFQRVTSMSVQGVIAGNFDRESADALRDAANDKLDELERNAVATACEQYATAKGNDLAMSDDTDLREAAREGRIELLLVKTDAGRVNPPTTSESTDSIANRTCISTLRHGGEVRLVPGSVFPETSGQLAATLRY